MSQETNGSSQSQEVENQLPKPDESFVYETPVLRKHGKVSDVTNLTLTPPAALDSIFGLSIS